jgi:two-component system, OmpR family, alkaline phosphatase synthesis response regulator PhoP
MTNVTRKQTQAAQKNIGSAAETKVQTPHEPADGRREAAMKSVLVVDDEPNIVLSLEFLIKQAGFEVRVARDGEEALTAVAERAPDLILLDVMIPKRDGYDVCQTIRRNPDWRAIPIIMLTAKGREVEREKGLALGASDYVTKPFSTRELSARVKKILA